MFTFDRGGFTVINVSNKPIESTANEVLSYMSSRFEFGGRKLKSPYTDPDGNRRATRDLAVFMNEQNNI